MIKVVVCDSCFMSYATNEGHIDRYIVKVENNVEKTCPLQRKYRRPSL